MNRNLLVALKTLVWLACFAPIAWLVWGAVTSNLGPDPTGEIAFDTGTTTLWLLIITLAISPVRRVLPGLSGLIRFRRLIGLFAFFYGSIHLLAYVGLYAGFDVPLARTPAQLAASLKADYERNGAIVKAFGINPNQ